MIGNQEFIDCKMVNININTMEKISQGIIKNNNRKLIKMCIKFVLITECVN